MACMKTLYCFNPDCSTPENPSGNLFCNGCGSSLQLKSRYQAIQLLGCGGFGRTFQGLDRRDSAIAPQPCAIKQLYVPHGHHQVQQKVMELFERESRWLYQLEEHPQTPSFIDYFTEKNNLYLIQELVIGQTLSAKISEKNAPRTEQEILNFLEEIVSILKYIHQYKVIHRDIKPDNLIFRERDCKWVLIDFGASRILSETALSGGATIIGTPEYMAPEQHRGQAFTASDLYSLGVICVQLITGQSTLEMFDIQTNCWRWTRFIPADVKLSSSFVALLDDLIAPTLGDRLQSALQVEQRIKRLRRRGSIDPEVLQATQLLSKPVGGEPSPAIAPEMDYENLVNQLTWQRWQGADQETWTLINQSVGKNPRQFLFPQDLPRIPCDVLQTIDQLWREYSQDRFGFSVQLRIYQEVEGEYHLFCHGLGWPLVPHTRKPELDFQFKLLAPAGHLPSRRQMGGAALWKNAQVFYEKLLACGL